MYIVEKLYRAGQKQKVQPSRQAVVGPERAAGYRRLKCMQERSPRTEDSR